MKGSKEKFKVEFLSFKIVFILGNRFKPTVYYLAIGLYFKRDIDLCFHLRNLQHAAHDVKLCLLKNIIFNMIINVDVHHI